MAIDALTTAIIDRIQASLSNRHNVPADQLKVVLASPDEVDSDATLLLFLYLVTPDPEQRNANRVRPFPTADDRPQRFAQAVPLELRYLVTTGAGAPPGPAGLARIAGAIVAIENGSPIVVPSAFQDAVWLSLLPLTSDEMSRIWGLFPNENCRTSFAFRAAPLWIDPTSPIAPSTQVSDDNMRASRLEGAAT